MKTLLLTLIFCLTLQAESSYDSMGKAVLSEINTLQKNLNDQYDNAQSAREKLLTQIAELKKSNQAIETSITELNAKLLETRLRSQKKSFQKAQQKQRQIVASLESLYQSIASFLPEPKAEFSLLLKALDKQENWIAYQQELSRLSLDNWQEAIGVQSQEGSINDNQDGSHHKGKIILVSRFAKLFANEQTGGVIRQSKDHGSHLQMVTESENTQALLNITQGQEGTVVLDLSNGAAFKLINVKRSLWAEVEAGGTTAYPLVVLGAICLLVALFKFFSLARIVDNFDPSMAALAECVNNNDETKAKELLAKASGPIAEIMNHIWTHRLSSRPQMEEFISESLMGVIPKLRSKLSILSVGAAAAPLLGLLGTVMGIIATFDLISVFGTGDASRLGEGIAEALITTKLGLLVAVPALIAHALLNRRVKTLIGSLEKSSLSFLNLFESK